MRRRDWLAMALVAPFAWVRGSSSRGRWQAVAWEQEISPDGDWFRLRVRARHTGTGEETTNMALVTVAPLRSTDTRGPLTPAEVERADGLARALLEDWLTRKNREGGGAHGRLAG